MLSSLSNSSGDRTPVDDIYGFFLSSNDLLWLDLTIGHQDYSANDNQCDMSYWKFVLFYVSVYLC